MWRKRLAAGKVTSSVGSGRAKLRQTIGRWLPASFRHVAANSAPLAEPLERRMMLSSASGVEISGSSVGFAGKSLTYNADLAQGTSGSGLSYQWNLLNQYGSAYTPPGGLGAVTSSSFVLPGTVVAGNYELTLAVSESGQPTQNAAFPLEILSDPQPSDLIYGTVPSVGGSSEARVSAMVKQPDGKIVVAGYWGTIGFDDPSFDSAYNASDWFVARFNPDLTLDPSFVNHHAFPARNSTPNPPDILVNGYFQSIQKMAINPANGDIILVGTGDYNPDNLYNSNGTWELQVAELVSKQTVEPDGSVVSPGSFDPKFNGGQPFDYTAQSGGQALTSVGEDVQVLSNGNLLVGGASELLTVNSNSDSDFLLLELTPSGTLDWVAQQPGISGAWGVNNANWFPGSTIFSLAVDNTSGAIYAGGVGSPSGGGPNTEGMAIVKYFSTGTIDTSFGSGGKVYTDSTAFGGSPSAFLSSMELLPSGNLLVVGQANDSYADPEQDQSYPTSIDAHVVMAEYSATSGALNSSYGSGGIVNTSIDFNSRFLGDGPNPQINGPTAYPQNLGAFAFEPNGNIVGSLLTGMDGASGWEMVRFVGDDGVSGDAGKLDTAFGSGGTVSLNPAASGWSSYTSANPGILLVSGDSILTGGMIKSTNDQPIQSRQGNTVWFLNQPVVFRYLLQAPAAGPLSAQQTSDGAVSLSWSVSLPGQTGFTIERSTALNGSNLFNPQVLDQVGSTQTDYVDTTASPNTQYYYQIVPFYSPGGTQENGQSSTIAAIYTADPTATTNVLQEAVQVPADGATVTTQTTLQAGHYYLIEASGQVNLDSGVTGDPAFWYSSSDPQNLNGTQLSVVNPSTTTNATQENYGIAVGTSGNLAIPDWGIADASHHSYFYVVAGTGAPLSFALQGVSNFVSGTGSLTVDMYAMNGTAVPPPPPAQTTAGVVTLELSVPNLGDGTVLPVLSASSAVDVLAAASDDSQVPWQLYAEPASGGAILLAQGSTSSGSLPSSPADVMTLNPSLFPDEIYTLLLTTNYSPPPPNSPPPPPPVSVTYQVVLAAPVMRITAPATAPDGITPVVNQSTSISVLSADPDGSQAAWSLYLVSSADSVNALLASSATSVGTLPDFGTTVATLDPSLYPNGTYQLELKNGSGTVMDSRTITIATAVKKGALQLPVTDGTVNTASGPVSITRTFDSSLVNVPPPTSADGGPVAPSFGPGWRFSMLDARLSTTAEADTVNAGSTTPVLRAGDIVYLTVPDGGEQAFEFDPIPVNSPNTFSGSQSSIQYLANFVALDGSGATLSFGYATYMPFYQLQVATQTPQRLFYNPADNQFGYPGATATADYWDPNNSSDGYEWYGQPIDDTTFIGFNPAAARTWPAGTDIAGWLGTYSIAGGSYLLTEKDGTSYTIDAGTGAITAVKDASGNTTTYNYSAGQVTATNTLGATLFTVVTNASNQVTSIQIPGQNPINYNYTAGNLTSVENQASQTTTYAYGDASYPHFVTGVTSPQNQPILKANYNDSTGMLASLVNANQVTIPITYGQIGNNEIAQTVTDAAGNVTEEFFNEQTGTALRKIQTLTSGQNVTGYIVTVANFNYVNNAVGKMSALYPSGEQVLQSVQNYNSFEVLGSDSAGVRFTQQPGTTSLLSQTTFDTVGDVSAPGYGQVLSSSAEQDNAGTLKTTLYSNYAIVTASGKREPLVTTVEIQAPDANQPTGYDNHIQSQTYNSYDTYDPQSNPNATGHLNYSLNVVGRNFEQGRDDEVGPFSDLGQGNYPAEIYLNLSGFTAGAENTTQTLAWNAADSAYEWADGTNASVKLLDQSLQGRGSGLPLGGDVWTLTVIDNLYGGGDGTTGTLAGLSFDGSPLGFSNLVAAFLAANPFVDDTTHQAVGNPVNLTVPDFLAQGTEYSYTNAGGTGATDSLVSQTQSVTAEIGLDGTVLSVSPYATTAQNTYYASWDYTQDPNTGAWVPNPGASYGQVEYSFNAAGQETFYAYNTSGQVVFQYVYKQWMNSSGQLVEGWVGTSNVYDSAGRQTDTYQATYLDNASDAAQTDHILPVISDGNGGIEIDTNTADSNYVTLYAGPLHTQHTDYDTTTGRVEDTVDQYGGMTSFTYDINGNKIETLYPNGTETLSVYDALNRAVWTTNQFYPGGPNKPILTHTIYNQLKQAIETDTFDGGTITISSQVENGATIYSSSISTTTINGVLTPVGGTFVSANKSYFDAAGHTIETIAPSGLRTGSIYYANGSVEYTGPLNASAPDGGHPITNSDGTSTTGFTTADFQVDSSTGYTTTLNNQFNSTLGLFYTQTIDQNGHATDAYSDALGRSVRTAHADGSFTETLYGFGSNAVSTDQESDSIPSPTTWQGIPYQGSETVSIAQRKTTDPVVPTYDVYDVANNLTDVYQAPVEDGDPNSSTYYPTYGQLVSPHWHYAYDTAGNEIAQVSPTEQSAYQTWTGNGSNPASVSGFTYFGFDQNGNQVLQKLPDGESETWTYNLQNQVTGHTDFDGNIATYTYATTGPQAGLLQSVVYAGASGSGKATQTVSYGYNHLNQQSSVTDASGTTTETYDDFGNLTESNTPEGIVWYAFDPATGNHLETYTANTEVYYGYNIQGRLATVTVKELNGQTITPLVTTYTYDPTGNKLSENDPNGDLIAYAYDALNRLKTETITDGSTTLFNEQFTLNDNGTRASATESQVQANGSTVTTSTAWTYDALQRLTGETYTSSASNENYSDVYTFDLDNNRMSKVHTGPGGDANDTITFAYNGDDELLTQTSTLSATTTNGYDPNGSLTTSTAGGVTTTYTYDARNKMVGYSSGSVVAAYVYDDAGNRVQETVNGTTAYYLTDTQNPTSYAQPIEQKSSPTAAPSVTYFLGERVSAQADPNGSVTYLLPDGHGSTEQLASSSGTVTAAFRYDAFGTPLNFMSVSAGTVFLFGGDAVYDPTSGTYMHGNGVRPTDGFLFIQRDTFAGSTSDPLTLHRYLYADANPISRNDANGHVPGDDGLEEEAAIDEQAANLDNTLQDEVKELSSEEQAGELNAEDGTEGDLEGGTAKSWYNSDNPNGIDHIFTDEHQLGPASRMFGSQANTWYAVQSAIEQLGLEDGIFSTTVRFGPIALFVTGNIINGVVNIGNFWAL